MASSMKKGDALFRHLVSILDGDPLMDELGLIQSAAIFKQSKEGKGLETSKDIEPDISDAFVSGDHKLGVAYWCVPVLFRMVAARFNSLHAQHIAEGNFVAPDSLDDNVLKQMHDVTRVLVLINADHYTAWNMRKLLIMQAFTSPAAEVNLLNLVFSKHPKSGEGWSHRRWTLARLWNLPKGYTKASHDDNVVIEYHSEQLQMELQVTHRTAEIYPKNYYAWTHRQWLISLVKDPSSIREELKVIEKWTSKHVSDHCGFHHRGFVLDHLAHFTSLEAQRAAWTQEMSYISSLMDDYPAHEALYMHRRHIAHRIMVLVTPVSLAPASPLVCVLEQEENFAQGQATDEELASFTKNRRFALCYQVWVLQCAIQLVQAHNSVEHDVETRSEHKEGCVGCRIDVLRKRLAGVVQSVAKDWPNPNSRMFEEVQLE